MPASGPVGLARRLFARSAHRASAASLRDHLPRAVFGGDQLVAVITDRQQSHRQVGDPGVAVAAEPRGDGVLVTGDAAGRRCRGRRRFRETLIVR